MILNKVTLKTKVAPPPPPQIEVLPTEKDEGLKFAVVYSDKKVIALCDSEFWARHFVERTNLFGDLTIREFAQ